VESIVIGKNANLYDLKNQLRWNEMYYI